jgi:hypothetical protein
VIHELLADSLWLGMEDVDHQLRDEFPDVFEHVDRVLADPAHRPSWRRSAEVGLNFSHLRWATCSNCGAQFVQTRTSRGWEPNACTRRCGTLLVHRR